VESPATSNIPWRVRTRLQEAHCIGFSSGSVSRLSNLIFLSKTNRVTRMAINPGIPIPRAMPRVSLERPFNGADDREDEDVAVCMVGSVSVPQSTEPTVDSVKLVIVGMDAEIAVEWLEPKVGVGVAEDDIPD
jgi:hypothetical protein